MLIDQDIINGSIEISNWDRERLENFVVNTLLEDFDDEYDEDDD